ncbi:MerR family DNA-binding transcriptional regulator [Paenibacillus tritici]|uniref:MerR family DNA-binding transcriptional regulator n=1 Tax=Paenibacillus tritici TaxID=1873425 RepID=UPI001FE42B56|nr:MerR family DNA-binding transcriptional regulator [Paenibacillus tritici]
MLTLSQVSEKTGLTPYTIRYFEKIGVLHEPKRSNGGARVYKESEVPIFNV